MCVLCVYIVGDNFVYNYNFQTTGTKVLNCGIQYEDQAVISGMGVGFLITV